LDHHESVYEYYRHHEQSMAFARFAGAVLARVYKPTITCDDGAEDAISEALAGGARVVISPNHTTADDQYVIVAMAQKLRALQPIRGRAFIPAEPSLFSRSGMGGKLLRRSVDGLGAIPTFRLEDLRRKGIEITDEIEERYRQAIVRCSDTQVAKLVAGHSMATTFADQINSIEAYRPQDSFSDALKGLHLYGAKVVRPEALVACDVDVTVA